MINDVLDNIIEIAITAIEQIKTGSIEEKAFTALNNFIAIASMAKGAKSMSEEIIK
jgi:hypothetical protein